MLFEKFPSIFYTLDNGKSIQTVTDILRRIVLSPEIRKNEAFYDQYDIKDGETPEMVSNYFYGDPQMHWIILMANDIIDPRFEWPLSYYNLIQYCKGKYGDDQIYHNHHYKNEVEFIVDGSRVIEEESTFESPVPIVFETSGAFESTLLFQNYNVKLLPVTNFDYEESLNESKRRILVIKPSIVSEIDSTFTQLVNT
jgi:hypothetical protein